MSLILILDCRECFLLGGFEENIQEQIHQMVIYYCCLCPAVQWLTLCGETAVWFNEALTQAILQVNE